MSGIFQISSTGNVSGNGVFMFLSDADLRGSLCAKAVSFFGLTHVSASLNSEKIRFYNSQAFILGVQTNVSFSNFQVENGTELNIVTGAIDFVGTSGGFVSVRAQVHIGYVSSFFLLFLENRTLLQLLLFMILILF